MKRFLMKVLRAAKSKVSERNRLREEEGRKRIDRKVINEYLHNENEPKLHVGCGGNILPGWLNADYAPSAPFVIHLDATKIFPFGGSTFNYVFSEHMIEHVSYEAGLFIMSEAFRVLKPGGIVRNSYT